MTNQEAYFDDLKEIETAVRFLFSQIPEGTSKKSRETKEKAERIADVAVSTLRCMKSDYGIVELDLKKDRFWSIESVRNSCIKNNLYTGGNREEYDQMLYMVSLSEPSTETLYKIAKNIKEHSDHQTISNVMYILENEAIITVFEIEGEEE